MGYDGLSRLFAGAARRPAIVSYFTPCVQADDMDAVSPYRIAAAEKEKGGEPPPFHEHRAFRAETL
jgi:hypothetical protein